MKETLIHYNAKRFHCTKPCPHGITIGSIEQYFPLQQEDDIRIYRERYSNTVVGVGSSVCETCKFYNKEKSTKIRYGVENMKGVVACMHP